MPGMAARIVWKAEREIDGEDRVPFLDGKSSIGETNWMPALLTRMSTPPIFVRGFGDHRGDLFGACDMSAPL